MPEVRASRLAAMVLPVPGGPAGRGGGVAQVGGWEGTGVGSAQAAAPRSHTCCRITHSLALPPSPPRTVEEHVAEGRAVALDVGGQRRQAAHVVLQHRLQHYVGEVALDLVWCGDRVVGRRGRGPGNGRGGGPRQANRCAAAEHTSSPPTPHPHAHPPPPRSSPQAPRRGPPAAAATSRAQAWGCRTSGQRPWRQTWCPPGLQGREGGGRRGGRGVGAAAVELGLAAATAPPPPPPWPCRPRSCSSLPPT